MYGHDILYVITKVHFKILHKISCLYMEKSAFYMEIKFQELLDLRACEHFWSSPLNH